MGTTLSKPATFLLGTSKTGQQQRMYERSRTLERTAQWLSERIWIAMIGIPQRDQLKLERQYKR